MYELLTIISVGCTSYLQVVSGDGESDETEQPPENLQRKYNGSDGDDNEDKLLGNGDNNGPSKAT